ncbi:uncharacterized protein LACBIDRAFT_332558 [Laccaria bicolor S238N-H82]|uniref:Predicted protein n=1 Tax=Laccaria bicolor (strain S238N-H82 / ATCC MYA-4686) TaxID=486041 RepID=B0DT46_LACBS|nr:uncharacterized protein LACBIDRAFT_332558 [Laccaria bicolor S238N-H82]EDR02213.1 predicted protein [Laccaria bicolor S238N-H82]|eukprot:XP_001887158.1 predicted protein [Laccaria bicolor S238N-H82]
MVIFLMYTARIYSSLNVNISCVITNKQRKVAPRVQYFTIPHAIHMDSTGFHWTPLDSPTYWTIITIFTKLDSTGLPTQNWTGLDWTGQTGLHWTFPTQNWTGQTGLDWTGLDSTGLPELKLEDT